MDNRTPILTMKGITKTFPGTVALDEVNFEVLPGEVHVLLGENGAGKSTLVKIVSGVYQADKGEMTFDGEICSFSNVGEAQEKGIGIIHQELNLLPERSIAQNIFIGNEPKHDKFPLLIDKKKMDKESRILLDSVGLVVDPSTLIKNLSIAQQQMVEVVKALSNKVKLLIMDEPTSSLTNREITKLFAIIRELKSNGIAIIYISHRMDEISQIGDRITILRDGQYISTVDVEGMDMNEIVRMMVGRSVSAMFVRNYNEPGEELFKTNSLSGLRFEDINISVRRGEIVSLSGLVGAGRTEIARAVFGCDPILSGSFTFKGIEHTKVTPRDCVNNGMALLPENRKTEGLVLPLSIVDNTVMSCHKKVSSLGLFSEREAEDVANHYKNKLRIATPNVEKIAFELSGGNQQKVVIAKWLALDCDFYIFDEPTRGIDVGAKAEIHALMDELVKEGAGILMISSELPEVVGLSDRVYVIRNGLQIAELKGDEITQERIIYHAIGGESA